MLINLQREAFSDPDVRMYTVTYDSQGHKVKGCFVVPEGGDVYPPLLYCRGGIRNVGKVSPRRMAELARQGYAVFAPHYRGNEGGEGRDEFGGADRHDVYHAVELFPSLPQVKKQRIACLGFSRGAFMALMAAANCDGIGPVAVWGGVSDLQLTYEERTDLRRMLRRVVGHPNKDAEQYIRRSPVHWADQIRSPILIIHGTEDQNVTVEHARRLAKSLKENEITHQLVLFEGMPHNFPAKEKCKALQFIFEWFAKHADGDGQGEQLVAYKEEQGYE